MCPQVWLSGHVPPSSRNYFPECVSALRLHSRGVERTLTFLQYVRYVELSLRFQDTILGHLYGVSTVRYFVRLSLIADRGQHMNMDHVSAT